MLDIQRLQRIRLSRYPLAQRATGQLLRLNYGLLPGVQIEFEKTDRLPPGPVIFAMNHTDRYNYFPFQVTLWQKYNRFTATWVKGKYYENALMASFLEKTNQLPTVSRGYLIARDFAAAMRRKPTHEEYQVLSRWVTTASETSGPPLDSLPESLLTENRNVLGYAYDSAKQDYASYINSIFRIMMKQFVALNDQAIRLKLDILIFPQGTRSVRLLPGRIGIAQLALHSRLPIVPVGCNGSDGLYPGSNPFAKSGRVVYRFGEPIEYADIPQFHPREDFEPFSPDSEAQHRAPFEGLAELITHHIDELLDDRHRLSAVDEGDATRDTERFL